MRPFLLLALLCSGCGLTAPTAHVGEREPDSSLWTARSGDYTNEQSYAFTWRTGAMNLWTSNTYLCQPPPFGEVRWGSYLAVFRATLPPLWQLGDTIRGEYVTSRPDSFPVIGGSFWATVEADTMRGKAIALLQSPCGARADTLPFRLVEVEARRESARNTPRNSTGNGGSHVELAAQTVRP